MDVCASGEIFTSFAFWRIGTMVAGSLLLLAACAGVGALVIETRRATWRRGNILVGTVSAFAAAAGVWSLLLASRFFAANGAFERYYAGWRVECPDPHALPFHFVQLNHYVAQVGLPLEHAALVTILLAAIILAIQAITLARWLRLRRTAAPTMG